MSHIASFNLKLENENRLKNALKALGCEITEGYFTDYYGHKATTQNGKEVAFGITFTGKSYYGNQQSFNRAGFIREKDGTLSMVGDMDGTGRSQQMISNAIENSYVNESITEIIPQLEALGFMEDESAVQLQYLNVC